MLNIFYILTTSCCWIPRGFWILISIKVCTLHGSKMLVRSISGSYCPFKLAINSWIF